MKLTSVVALSLAGMLAGCQYIPWQEEEPADTSPPAAERTREPATPAPADPEEEKRQQKETLIAKARIEPLAEDEVGFYMDIQEARLRQELLPAGVSVTRDGDRLVLNMPGQLTFDMGSTELSEEVQPLLDSIAKVLAEYDKTLIELHGHTDDSGPDDYNQRLSERRADSLAQYLSRHGVDIERMLVVGSGESMPIASNETEEGRRLNRRVELSIEPIRAARATLPASDDGSG